MIPRTGTQPEPEELPFLPLSEQLTFYDIVQAETDPRYRTMLRWATSRDADSTRGERLLNATLAKMWLTPVSHSE